MAEPMDIRLKDFILGNLPELKAATNCNDDLLDKMVARGVFTIIDKQEIVSIL